MKKGDFVEIEYTGKTKEEGFVFDTTDASVAKENTIYNESYSYGPVIICLGENQVLKGIDRQLEGREVGSYTLTIPPEDAFGKKNAKLLRMIPMSAFKKQNIMPHPGLQINMDGAIGTVRSVNGGRTIVDFNHPLASKDLTYEIKVNRIVSDDREKIQSYLKIALGQKDIPVSVSGNQASITLPFELPAPYAEPLAGKLKELTGKEISFLAEQKSDEENAAAAAQKQAPEANTEGSSPKAVHEAHEGHEQSPEGKKGARKHEHNK